MKMHAHFPLALAAVLSACQDAPSSDAQKAERPLLATGSITDREGKGAGSAALRQDGDKIYIALELNDLEPGTRALHLHSVGECSLPDFKSAGGHLNPDEKSHGKLSAGGQHLGDLPNLEIPENGSLSILIDLDGRANSVLAAINDDDGTAVMIHAGPDDYLSDPAGAAGPRIACGVLKPID